LPNVKQAQIGINTYLWEIRNKYHGGSQFCLSDGKLIVEVRRRVGRKGRRWKLFCKEES
ncbi:MAG: hypothetical protein H8E13_17870, partial [Actinobacteria bacterium]|nr:hypothetical protein [Actinomycetota bacterium]